MTRKFLVGGNWKCNGTTEEVKKIVIILNEAEVPSEDIVEVVVSPPFVFLTLVKGLVRSDFHVTAQNYWVRKGSAFMDVVNDSMKHVDFWVERTIWVSASSTTEEVTQGIDGTGLTAIVTGASSGIGVETTRVLALHGVHVVMTVRNVDVGRNVKEAILKEIPGAKIDVMELDLSSMATVRKFASEYQSSSLALNLLINNAGVMATPFMLSHDNIELQLATNHLGHFLLTKHLLETIKTTARERNRE
ncbi:hypothetical protein CRYUN_Cryun22dG0044700 [Craigia yunnanensis]